MLVFPSTMLVSSYLQEFNFDQNKDCILFSQMLLCYLSLPLCSFLNKGVFITSDA